MRVGVASGGPGWGRLGRGGGRGVGRGANSGVQSGRGDWRPARGEWTGVGTAAFGSQLGAPAGVAAIVGCGAGMVGRVGVVECGGLRRGAVRYGDGGRRGVAGRRKVGGWRAEGRLRR